MQSISFAETAAKIGVLETGSQAGHYFQKNGKPILLIGDNLTQGWMETGTNYDQTAYVDALSSRGMNLLMLWTYFGTNAAFQQGDSRLGYDAPEIWPWQGSPDHRNFDLTQLNQAFFDRLKQLVAYAESKGIIVLICVHDGWSKTRFDGHPFNSAIGNGPLRDSYHFVELANYSEEMPSVYDSSWTWQQKNQYFQERFSEKLISELNSYSNVIYEMFNEGHWYDPAQRYQHEQHFLAFFRARCNNLLLTNSDEIDLDDPHNDAKVDVVTYHGDWTSRFNDFQGGFSQSPAKPYLLSEPVPGWDGTNLSLADIRRSIWEVTLAGAGWVNQNDLSFGWDPNAAIASEASLRNQAYDYAGYAARFFNNSEVNFSNMAPRGDLSSTGICLAQEGREYAVYAPSGGSFTVNLAAGSSYAIHWYNPRSGQFEYESSAEGGGNLTVTSPDNNDWVAHIRTNGAPLAYSGTISTSQDTVVSGTLGASDSDGDALTYALVSNGSLGTVNITNSSTGAYTYAPDAGVSGTDMFTFKVNDGMADSNVATVTVTIVAQTTPPPPPIPVMAPLCLVSNNYCYPGEDWTNAIDGDTSGWDGTVTANDSPPYAIFAFADNTTKSISKVRLLTDTGVGYASRWVTRFTVLVSTTDTNPSSFTTVLNSAGKNGGAWQEYGVPAVSARYIKLVLNQPSSGWRQIGEFEVWTGGTPVPTNQLPVAYDGAATATSNTTLSGTLRGSDPDGDALTYALVTGGSLGTVNITNSSTGAYTYTPNTGASGTDLFTFKVNDGKADSNVATVTVTIVAETPPPPTPELAPLRLVSNNYCYPGEDWSNAIDGDTSGWDGTVTANDSPPYAIFAFADNTTKAISKVRLLTDTGVGYASRWVTGFTALVSTTDTNPSSFTTVLNSAGKNGGAWQEYGVPAVSARYIKLVLNQPSSGWRQIGEFEVWTGGTPVPTNQAPVAYSGSISTSQDTAVSGTLSASDTDMDALTYALVNSGALGTVKITDSSTGAYTYTPNTGVSGTDLFTFKVNDGMADSNVATVVVTIVAQTTPPPPPTPVLASLRLVSSNYCYPNEDWSNAIDGDTSGWDGTVSASDSLPYAIFAFADNTTKSICKFRLLTDTGVGYASRWVTQFTVQVSITDTNASSFTTTLNNVAKNGGAWQEYGITPVYAKYIKLILNQPSSGWRQIGEFEVYVHQ